MVKTFFPLLIMGTALLSGCVAQQTKPAGSSLTQAQLNQSLNDTEIRLSQKIEQQCSGWQKQQQSQLQHLSDLQQSQQKIDSKIEGLHSQLNAPPKAQAAAKPAAPAVVQCPTPAANP